MAETINKDEQAIIDKARSMTSETIPVGGDADGPPPSPATPSTPTGGVDTNPEVWGPYADGEYHQITPPWGGQFGVPVFHELHFEEKERLIKGEIRTIKIPVVVDMTKAMKELIKADA